MRRVRTAAAAVIVGLATFVTVAQATFQPAVLYQPPVLKSLDYKLHNSVENMVAEANGPHALVVRNTPASSTLHADSERGCGFAESGVTCPVAGLKRLILKLGPMEDSGRIDLGRHAGRMKQTILGGPGGDTLEGGRGRQRLVGGLDGDLLTGGPGDDVINGGPGDDICAGGPGNDVLKSCTPP